MPLYNGPVHYHVRKWFRPSSKPVLQKTFTNVNDADLYAAGLMAAYENNRLVAITLREITEHAAGWGIRLTEFRDDYDYAHINYGRCRREDCGPDFDGTTEPGL